MTAAWAGREVKSVRSGRRGEKAELTTFLNALDTATGAVKSRPQAEARSCRPASRGRLPAEQVGGDQTLNAGHVQIPVTEPGAGVRGVREGSLTSGCSTNIYREPARFQTLR